MTAVHIILAIALMIAGLGTVSAFFPSIRLRATYHGIEREVYLRRERTAVIIGTKKRAVKRTNRPAIDRRGIVAIR